MNDAIDPATDAAYGRLLADRALPGEDLSTTHLDDCDHWIAVYGELLAFKGSVIDQVLAKVAESPELFAELGEIDLPLLRREAERLARRHAAWTDRLGQLIPASGP